MSPLLNVCSESLSLSFSSVWNPINNCRMGRWTRGAGGGQPFPHFLCSPAFDNSLEKRALSRSSLAAVLSPCLSQGGPRGGIAMLNELLLLFLFFFFLF